MKVTLTDLLPDKTERTVTAENLTAETFDDAVALFKGAALAVGFTAATVDGLKTRTDQDDSVQAIRDAIEATRVRLEARVEAQKSLADRIVKKVFGRDRKPK